MFNNPFLMSSPRLNHRPRPGSEEEPRGKGTPLSATVNLLATAMGAGLLSLPRAFACTGLGMGVFLLLLIGWAADLSLQFLVVCSRHSKKYSYEGNVEYYLGVWGKRVTSALLLLLLFMASVAMTVIIMQLLGKFVQEGSGHPDAWYSNQVVIGALCLCVVFPLCLMEQITILRYTSAVALCNLAYYCTVLSVRVFGREGGFHVHETVVAINPNVWEILLGFSVMVSAYICHFNIFKIDCELKMKHKHQIWGIIHCAIPGVATCIYIFGGGLGYILYGAAVKNNMLEEFAGDTLMSLARVAIALTNMFKMPLIIQPLRASIQEVVPGIEKVKCPSTAVLMALILGVAWSLGSLSKALGLLGCTAGMAVCFILPGLMRVQYSHQANDEAFLLAYADAPENAPARQMSGRSQMSGGHHSVRDPLGRRLMAYFLTAGGSMMSLGSCVATIVKWKQA